jgi:hypothetical protein
MSGSAFAVTHHAFSSGAGRTSDGNGSHASTLKSPSYTKSVSWQHYLDCVKKTFPQLRAEEGGYHAFKIGISKDVMAFISASPECGLTVKE